MGNDFFHKIDPEGDVLLILHTPCAPFAVWDVSEETSIQDLNAWFALPTQGSIFQDQFDTDIPSEVEAPEPVPVWDGEPLAVEMPPSEECEAKKDSCGDEPHKAPNTDTSSVRFLLSSRHLILASRYFNTKLKGPWVEASVSGADGRRHIEASDWDDQAFLLFMRVLHGLNNEVPRKVSLEMLAKIAVLVDYYDCCEAVDLAAHIWIDSLKGSLPLGCNRDLILWILISRVFHQPDIFLSVTKTAIQESRAPLPTLELPISVGVISRYSLVTHGAKM
ncbi:hypothetical protein CDEST_15375 [Colletotrichum destructivum]|uniref:BTB domain-containing protein n=1 Tax=Colletotrichum destructivum TaxID=34406 RepID=A0AAX4J4G4_9PEZI|nr:hypothetical protein CDEST_15375 [Colletotrichum destructivum]